MEKQDVTARGPSRMFLNQVGVSPTNMSQDSDRCLPLEDLLPGIPDQITLDKIASKLSWKCVNVLSSVSRGWRHATRSRQVYEARVRAETRETLALISCGAHGDHCEIIIYSIRDNSCYRLPPILSLRTAGIPYYTQCVALDGKVYLLVRKTAHTHPGIFSRNVYVIDVAGQRQWKQCASMKVERSRIKCGVINGKIFVFGVITSLDRGLLGEEVYDSEEDTWSPRGLLGGEVDDPQEDTWSEEDTWYPRRLLAGEIYDPEEDTWSPIKTLISTGEYHELKTVEAVGQELFLYGYTFPLRGTDWNQFSDERLECLVLECSVYHPVKDEWGELNSYFTHNNSLFEFPFAPQGSLHKMTYEGIYIPIDIPDADHLWVELHTFSRAGNSVLLREEYIIDVKVVEDELLVLTHSRKDDVELLQTKGFGGDKRTLQLKKAPVDFCSGNHSYCSFGSISLLQL